MFYRPTHLLPLLFVWASLCLPAWAEEPPETETKPRITQQHPQVIVTASPEDNLSGDSTLTRDTLDILPTHNGSISEAISILPGTQLPETTQQSSRGGEIAPPNVSISGGKPYQNYFTIDGIGTNSYLSPMADNPNSTTSLPNHPQTLFLNTALIDAVTLYRYNVPASYGEFTGGVIVAESAERSTEVWGEITYRTTRDAWSEFFIEEEDRSDFENSDSLVNQPHFEKHQTGYILNTPLSESISLLTGYQLLYSKIPLKYLNTTKDQSRKNENFLAKLDWDISPRTRLTGSIYYAPYENSYFTPNSVDGDLTIGGDSYLTSIKLEQAAKIGTIEYGAAYFKQHNKRNAAPDLRPWLANINGAPTSRSWGNSVGDTYLDQIISYEGSVGPLETEQQSWQTTLAIRTSALRAGNLLQRINSGVKYERVEGSTLRTTPTSTYLLSSAGKIDTDGDGVTDTYIVKNDDYPDISCPTGSNDCIDNEQLFLSRSHLLAGYAEESIDLLNIYLEDELQWLRLNLRPGIHISYDDYTDNLNKAPRLALSIDLFGTGNTLMIGGLNRYYGRTLITHKLREAYPSPIFQTRSVDTSASPAVPNDWTGVATSEYRYSELKTPYSDETVLGIEQALAGGELKLTYVRREGRDEFAQETTDRIDGIRYTQLNNLGKSHHEEYSLEWARHIRKLYLALNLTYQESYSTNANYSDSFELEDSQEKVLYKGEIVDRSQLPREDFNRPLIGNLIVSTPLPYGFEFTNVNKYRGHYLARKKTSPTPSDLPPDVVAAYEDVEYRSNWTTDWVLSWQTTYLDRPTLKFTLEANNVFNEKVRVADDDAFKTGRQFWAGMSYQF